MMIAGFTLFIDFSHFEVSIMIALTSMLVTYTLYQSISAYLPQTSYMKMIDIWLFGGCPLCHYHYSGHNGLSSYKGNEK